MLNLDEIALLVSSITHVTDQTNFPFIQRYRERETSGSGLLYSATKRRVAISPSWLHLELFRPSTNSKIPYPAYLSHLKPTEGTYLPMLELNPSWQYLTTGKTITKTMMALSLKALNPTSLLPPYTYHNIKCIDRSINATQQSE